MLTLSGNKLFGVAFDPPTSHERLDVKSAYLHYRADAPDASTGFSDPYDFTLETMRANARKIEEASWFGKMEIDSWLTPKPSIKDLPLLFSGTPDLFLESDGCRRHMEDVRRFVDEHILPARPYMIGVDHCSTGGAVMALARHVPNLNVVVLDSHFDVSDGGQGGAFCHCGNFLRSLLDGSILAPENLWVLGANTDTTDQDTGDGGSGLGCEAEQWVKRGVHLVTKEMLPKAAGEVQPTGPVYLSVDIDIGSLSSIFSARFMNCYGLDRPCLFGLLRSLKDSIDKRGVPVVGMDVMELDVHFLETARSLMLEDCTSEFFLALFTTFCADAVFH